MKLQSKRTTLLGSILALAISLAGIVGLGFTQHPRGERQTLPDGTVLELCGVTHGKQHELVLGNWWQRTIVRFVQDHFSNPGASPWTGGGGSFPSQPNIDGNRVTFETNTDEYVLWFRIHHPQPTNGGFYDLADRTMTVDAHGCHLPCYEEGSGGRTIYESEPVSGSATDTIAAAEMPIFPRREPRFKFGFYLHQGEKPLAQFSIANPAPLATATWAGQNCPVTASGHGASCTLESLRHVPEPLNEDNTIARFTGRDNQHPGRRMQVNGVVLSDATGNEWAAHLTIDRNRTTFFTGLCPYEAAWKMTVFLDPPDPWKDAPDFVWTLPSVPVASKDHSLPLQDRILRDGVQLQATDVTGTGKIQTRMVQGTFTQPEIMVDVKAQNEILLTLQSVQDERGRELLRKEDRTIMHVSGSQESYSIRLPSLGSARRLRVMIGVTQPRDIELMVKPPVPNSIR